MIVNMCKISIFILSFQSHGKKNDLRNVGDHPKPSLSLSLTNWPVNAWHRSTSLRATLHPRKMPRIPTSLLLKAYRENSLLPLLLKECRSLDSARNELRWLRERAVRDVQEHSRQVTRTRQGWRTRLRAMCHKRSRGVPLQYILGDQPFGDLEILCRRGVLIPRCETALPQRRHIANFNAPSKANHLPGLTRNHIHMKQPDSSAKWR